MSERDRRGSEASSFPQNLHRAHLQRILLSILAVVLAGCTFTLAGYEDQLRQKGILAFPSTVGTEPNSPSAKNTVTGFVTSDAVRDLRWETFEFKTQAYDPVEFDIYFPVKISTGKVSSPFFRMTLHQEDWLFADQVWIKLPREAPVSIGSRFKFERDVGYGGKISETLNLQQGHLVLEYLNRGLDGEPFVVRFVNTGRMTHREWTFWVNKPAVEALVLKARSATE